MAVFLLLVALALVFCWRVATADPSWKASAPAAKPQPPSAAAAPKPVETATPTPSKPVEPEAETVVELPARPARRTPSAPKPAAEEAPPPDPAQISAYLAAHLGQKIPLLRNGARRDVTLAAFTDDQIMVRAGSDDLTTISRASLGADQLRLWK